MINITFYRKLSATLGFNQREWKRRVKVSKPWGKLNAASKRRSAKKDRKGH